MKAQHVATPRGFSTPSESSTNNRAYECIDIGRLVDFDPGVVERFRQYLKTIPFTFTNSNPTTPGRRLRTEADVRTFLDASVIVPCWPVCLAMVSENRDFDIQLRCELSSNDEGITVRPAADAHVAEYRPDSATRPCYANTRVRMQSTPSDACRNSRAIVQPTSWDVITSQLRKYTV